MTDENQDKKEEEIKDEAPVEVEETALAEEVVVNLVTDYSHIKSGMTVRVHEKIKEIGAKGAKERIQVFEGIVLSRKGGNQKNATITVHKLAADRVYVEKVFPLNAPTIAKIEIVKKARTRRAKLYFLRNYKKKLKETILGK